MFRYSAALDVYSEQQITHRIVVTNPILEAKCYLACDHA